MLASKIYYKVKTITEEEININGYSYTKVKALVPGGVLVDIIVSDKSLPLLEVGKCYYAKRAYMTSYNTGKNCVKPFCFRIDWIEEVTEEVYLNETETTVKFNGRFKRRDWEEVKSTGPMMVPTFSTRIKVLNETKEDFNVLLVGFHSRARLLAKMSKVCYVDIDGTISAPRVDGRACAIIAKDINIRKEVEV